MFRSIFTKTLYSLWWPLFGWSLAIMGVAFITMALYPSFSQAGIENVVNSIPESLKSFVGNVDDFKSIPGFIGQQIFGPNLYIIGIIMAIFVFLSVSANEESDGRLQTLLSFPVSRTNVFFQKYLAAALVVTIASISVIVAVWMGLLSIGETANYSRIWQSIASFTLINLAYGTLAFATSFFTGSKGVTILVASAYTAASILIASLAPAVSSLEDISKGSLLYFYNNPQIMTNGINGEHTALLVVVIIGLLVIGWSRFVKRNVYSS